MEEPLSDGAGGLLRSPELSPAPARRAPVRTGSVSSPLLSRTGSPTPPSPAMLWGSVGPVSASEAGRAGISEAEKETKRQGRLGGTAFQRLRPLPVAGNCSKYRRWCQFCWGGGFPSACVQGDPASPPIFLD